ncbi:MAG TPA: sigma-70 family RNA polymerase sigma factor [Gemmatimonadaceae bacterium]
MASLSDRHARFDALVLPHLDRLLAFAARRTNVRADAEDAVQEACGRAWLGLDDLRDPAKVRAWLYRILRGVLSESEERNARRRQLVSITRLEEAHGELVSSDSDMVFDEVASRLTGEEVRDALQQLPDDFATVVELHDIDGFKYHEIAEIVGAPIGTVMSRISRGRRLLAGAVLSSRTVSRESGFTRERRSSRQGGGGAGGRGEGGGGGGSGTIGGGTR